ncbi:MAG: hypothetical protein ACM3PX_09710 [Omnitrophica WOR_2 bacterium]
MTSASAQEPGSVNDSSLRTIIVDKIIIVGNEQTDESIIARELLFHEGDTLQTKDLSRLIAASKENILKTLLFHDAIIVNDGISEHITFLVRVSERWYWWIWPLIENPDRNFNDWWQHHDLSRLSAGLHYQHENARGRSEKLHIKGLAGYRTYVEASYEWPYINSSKTIGAGFYTSYSSQKEINFATENNRQVFYHGQHVMLKSFLIGGSIRYRPGNYVTNSLTVQFSSLTFNDTLQSLNPDYLKSTIDNPKLVSLSYLIKADYRDNRTYPLKGYYLESELGYLVNLNNNFNVQSWRTSIRGHVKAANRLYAAAELALKLTFPEVKPYYLQNALGFDRNFVRGYEYMVIEGAHYWLAKTQLRYAVLPGIEIHVPFVKSERFNTIPLSIYAGPHLDAGRVFPSINPDINPLEGKVLCGYGFGIDFVTYYDKVLRCEYTFRCDGLSGFFLHFMAMI